jgi:hypothetical protein
MQEAVKRARREIPDGFLYPTFLYGSHMGRAKTGAAQLVYLKNRLIQIPL